METGPFFSGTLLHPGGPTIKGLAIKLGDREQAAVCFDTELLRFSCGWTDGFLKFNPARYGLIAPPAIDGTVHFTSPKQPGCTPFPEFVDRRPNPPWGPLPEEIANYQGLSLHGRRVVLHYSIGSTNLLESPWVESSEKATLFTREWLVAKSGQQLKLLLTDGKSVARLVGEAHGAVINPTTDGSLILTIPPQAKPFRLKVAIWSANPAHQADCVALWSKSPPAVDVDIWTKAGPTRWGQPLVTVGQVAQNTKESATAPFVVDTLTLPFKNPYNALMFVSGLDFFANGNAAICTAHGDVWLVSGIDQDLKRITWKRFATGLFQPLGLKIIKSPANQIEAVYVLGRDQITVLHDQNNDGEADYYENFNNAGQATANSHEFATCLETDSKGNLYYLRGDSGSQTHHDGCLLRASPDGKKLDVFATGFRNANGLGIGPDDTITVAPQEGTWTPGSAIFSVKQGGFYGAMQSHHRSTAPTTFEPPICWIPRQQDNSSGGQIWVPRDTWKQLSGQLLHFSFGTCKMFLTVREPAGELTQGGTVQFPLTFDSGIMRGRFRPADNHLYVAGLKGWVSSAVQDGCLQRVRYTGQSIDMPVAMKTFSNGIALTFSSPLAAADAEDPDNYSIEQWNYRWSGNYGSADYRVSFPNQIGHDEVHVESSTLLPDGRTVFLEIPDMKPAMQMAISYTISNTRQQPIHQTFNATIHRIGSEPQPATLVRKPRSGQLHPEIEQALVPGLLLRSESSGNERRNHFGISRLAALSIDDPSSDTRFTGVKRLTWSGYLRTLQKAEYRFYFSEQQKLSLDGREIHANTPTMLGRGYHRLEFVHANPPANGGTGRSDIRLMWKSEAFPLEAVPPTSLFTSLEPQLGGAAAEIQEGRDLFQWHGCANCHATENDTEQVAHATTEPVTSRYAVRRQGPILERVGRRLNPEWLAEWIERPRHLRPQALMPSLFHSADLQHAEHLTSGNDTHNQQVIADLVSYLTSQSGGDTESLAFNASAGDLIAEGRQLYQAQGCMGCHRLTPPHEPDDYTRLPLYYVAQKFRSGALAEFLKQPQQHYLLTRMPDFRFNDREAQSLEAFLRSEAKAELTAKPELAKGDPKRGATLFAEIGCLNCHPTSISTPPNLVTSLRAPHLPKIPETSGKSECRFNFDQKRTHGLPFYEFSATESLKLQAYLSARKQEGSYSRGTTESQRLMRHLNCAGCHSRDGKNSPLGELVADEGDGLPAEAIPHLTWAGEKLKPDWIKRLLSGKLNYKTRPLLKARMPAFPAYAWLGEELAREHGVAAQSRSAIAPVNNTEDSLVEIGRQLTLKSNGLDCRQCHGVGSEQPSGDKATLISPGINFSITAERMNFDFLPQLLLNPPRYDPTTRMPVFSVDGKTTAAKGILDGDVDKQFQAIRSYLITIPPLK